MARLKDKYLKECVPALMKKYGYKNVMQVPKIEKVVINMGVGEAITNIKLLDAAVEELARIAGQKPVITRAKKSIANFKLRQGMPIGCMVTLRKSKMYEFLDRFLNVALPRVRDFRGVSKNAFDGRGNYALGIKEHMIFPEIDIDNLEKIKGMNVVIVTTAKTDEETKDMLKILGMPFRN
jgi:large subunit ribosomal protein L5